MTRVTDTCKENCVSQHNFGTPGGIFCDLQRKLEPEFSNLLHEVKEEWTPTTTGGIQKWVIKTRELYKPDRVLPIPLNLDLN